MQPSHLMNKSLKRRNLGFSKSTATTSEVESTFTNVGMLHLNFLIMFCKQKQNWYLTKRILKLTHRLLNQEFINNKWLNLEMKLQVRL